MGEDKLRAELADSVKSHAMIYLHLFEEMSIEFGAEKATEVMKRAIHKYGVVAGQRFAMYAPDDLSGLRDAYLSQSLANGELFDPLVNRCDKYELDITLRKCPLKEAWLEHGLIESEVARLCEIASVVDIGTFEGNGFDFSAETYKPGGDSCCHLHIRPKK